ncbi:hypothetical protein AB0M02_35230 [Actinoplanes sp. NPDC051861]|uniref:hypothetical protein n=1 Tax=Actinoplanes sp. NPDC051861 TaxID=3155170 RepID=UPI003445D506
MTRLAVAAGTVAAALSIGASAVHAAPPSTPAEVPEFEFYDWYPAEADCKKDGDDGKTKKYWFDYQCNKAEGRWAGKFGLYVQPNPDYVWPTAPVL